MAEEIRKRELEKRRRIIVVPEDESPEDAGALNLKLCGHSYSLADGEADKLEGRSGKKTKAAGNASNRPVCQVENCGADLTSSKDYHRRHKVCETFSKATQALVANVLQRFCQQCSRFHVLQEFDEGKRSCRRQLAGHNRRRRKTHPETAAVNIGPQNDEQSCSYLLICLLRILSNLHANNSDQNLLSHLLRSLATLVDATNANNTFGLAQGSQIMPNAEPSAITPEKSGRQDH